MGAAKWAVPLLLLAVLLAGGWVLVRGDSEVYAVPQKLCEVPVTPSALQPLLPPGEKLEVDEIDTENPLDAPILLCRVHVDDETVMALNVRAFSSPSPDLMEKFRAARSAYGIANPHEDSIDGEYAIVDAGGSLVETACPGRGGEAVLEINVKDFSVQGDSGEGRERMKNFTEDFMNSAREVYC
ncbi:hypothetical protein [Streptomyces hoynatensis]|uniref:DUF3558 domain-containing protein n=1 Tax=Streptomyces hoynatensis TaxID=1141874 RepID=A0A3A9ZIK3_9ACTN|nr:hypothetical protein [Streptomyces hoynatensis]RKN47137.1 hypothetical protein D7294_02895 [Streptomyces hoynatensis]